jgi:hypothetical protein
MKGTSLPIFSFSKRLMVVTGARMSTESEIPDYRVCSSLYLEAKYCMVGFTWGGSSCWYLLILKQSKMGLFALF